MIPIPETILGVAEQMVEMHDNLQFKSQVYDASPLAGKLKDCARLLAKASDGLVQDIVYELSKREFPLTSRVRGRRPPPNDFNDILNEAIGLFPTDSLPVVDVQLKEVPDSLDLFRTKITGYLDDKNAAIAPLMAHQDQVLNYLISTRWTDA